MKSPIFTSENSKLLLALRTRTVNGIRADFSNMYTSLFSPLCGKHVDNLENLLKCDIVKSNQRTNNLSRSSIGHGDIYSNDVRKQKEITELYSECLIIREQLMNSTPVAVTGPVH